MNKIKYAFALCSVFATLPSSGYAAGTNDMFGSWSSLMFKGDFKFLSPKYDKFKWLVFDQARTREDSPNGTRFTENLMFSQIGYQMNSNASFWLGYVHDWIHPLNKTAFQESRPYEDFVWNQKFDDTKLTLRTRMEERINITTGDTGYRARQFFQVSHPLPFMDGLSAYLGDELLFYLNQNKFGKQGLSENRIFSGLSYQFTDHAGLDIGYMGQFVDNSSGKNLFTHNLQTNLRYQF